MNVKIIPSPRHENEDDLDLGNGAIPKYELNFMECDTCSKKPGSPLLCAGCQHNRYVINKLNLRWFEKLMRWLF